MGGGGFEKELGEKEDHELDGKRTGDRGRRVFGGGENMRDAMKILFWLRYTK